MFIQARLRGMTGKPSVRASQHGHCRVDDNPGVFADNHPGMVRFEFIFIGAVSDAQSVSG
jgi:hypothetical protein